MLFQGFPATKSLTGQVVAEKHLPVIVTPLHDNLSPTCMECSLGVADLRCTDWLVMTLLAAPIPVIQAQDTPTIICDFHNIVGPKYHPAKRLNFHCCTNIDHRFADKPRSGNCLDSFGHSINPDNPPNINLRKAIAHSLCKAINHYITMYHSPSYTTTTDHSYNCLASFPATLHAPMDCLTFFN